MLRVKLLYPDAIMPTVANIGEDHGYDLYAREDVTIHPGQQKRISTGIAIEFWPKAGGRIGDRSSMGQKGITKRGGEIDAGYRGEVTVTLHNGNWPTWFTPITYIPLNLNEQRLRLLPDFSCDHEHTLHIKKGDKIAQLVREDSVIRHCDSPVQVEVLSPSSRGDKGFGSSGR